MVKTYRNLKFHRLRMYDFTANSEESTQRFLNLDQENEALHNILESIKSDPKIEEFTSKKHSTSIEFISGIDGYMNGDSAIICGKLSKPKDRHAYQLRKKGTSQQRSIVQEEDEQFEAKSYFIIDTSTMIIGYLFEQSAPQIYALGDFVSEITAKNNEQHSVFGAVSDIAIEDMIDNLSQSAYIGTIEYFMEIPKNMPVDVTGLSEKEYRNLSNQKLIRSTISLVADKRGVSVFDEDAKNVQETKKGFFQNLKDNLHIRRVKVKMKHKEADKIQTVDLVNNPLIYKVDFDYGNISDSEFDNSICNKLTSEFAAHKDEIEDLYR